MNRFSDIKVTLNRISLNKVTAFFSFFSFIFCVYMISLFGMTFDKFFPSLSFLPAIYCVTILSFAILAILSIVFLYLNYFPAKKGFFIANASVSLVFTSVFCLIYFLKYGKGRDRDNFIVPFYDYIYKYPESEEVIFILNKLKFRELFQREKLQALQDYLGNRTSTASRITLLLSTIWAIITAYQLLEFNTSDSAEVYQIDMPVDNDM